MSSHLKLGSFRLETEIGSGGMADVWRADDATRDLTAAVKIIDGTGADNPETREQFRREVEAIARLRHPGIVTVYDYGIVPPDVADRSDGALPPRCPYLAMEYATGGELDATAHIGSWSDLSRLLTEILDALAFAHAREIIHRDLKPANVLLVDDDEHPYKLSDFGIAHALDPYENPSKGEINTATFGTPHYMPPEQLRGKWREFGPWTDLYALGCMCFEIVTGEVPFGGDSLFAIRRQHLEEPLPEIEPRFPVPDGLPAWIQRVTRKDPRARYRRAADAAEVLHRLDPPDEAPAEAGEVEPTNAPEAAADIPADAPTLRSPSTDAYAETLTTNEETEPTEGLEHSQTIFDEDEAPGSKSSLGLAETRHGIGDVGPDLDGVEADSSPVEDREVALPEEPPKRAPEDSSALASIRLFGLRELPLVDRDTPCEQLWSTLHRAMERRAPQAVLLRGPSGLGKSQLADWFARSADECGCATVLRAEHSVFRGPTSGLARMLEIHLTAWDLDRGETYGRVHDKLADIYERAGSEIDDRYLEDDAHALTEMIRPGTAQTARRERGSQFTFSSVDERNVVVARLLSNLASIRPVVLQLEDVHWGSETVSFVEQLLGSESLTDAPIAVVMTARDDSLEDLPEMDRRLETLTEREAVTDLPIGALDDRSHRQLVREVLHLDDELADRVYRRTDGDPLFAVQLVTEWVDRGDVTPGPAGFEPDGDESLEVPDDPETFWRRRLDRFLPILRRNAGEDAEEALFAAAALGENVSDREWKHICREAGLRGCDDIVNTLVRFGLADRREDSWSFGFGQLRDAVAVRARARGKWRDAHLACAAMLERMYGGINPEVRRRRALHLLAGQQYETALEPLLDAIERAMKLGQYNDAEYLLERRLEAIEALDLPQTDTRRLDNWITAGRMYKVAGQRQEAWAYLERALPHARHTRWSEGLGRALGVEASLLMDDGEFDRALESTLEAEHHLRQTEPLSQKPLADILRTRGGVLYYQADYDRAVDCFRKAADLFASSDEMSETARCKNHQATMFVADGDYSRAEQTAEQALDKAQLLRNPVLEADCLNNLAEVARARSNFDDARRLYRRASTLWKRSGSRDFVTAEFNALLCHLGSGDLQALEEGLPEFEESAATLGIHFLRPFIDLLHAYPAADHGDWSSWSTRVERAVDATREMELVDRDLGWLADRIGRRTLEAGEIDRGRHLLEFAAEQYEAVGADEQGRQVRDYLAGLE